MKILIPISVGELLDKISILSIKSQYIDSEYVKMELEDLVDIAKEYNAYDIHYISQLFQVNLKLWEIEENLRKLEREKSFDLEFVNLSRSVYITNDLRASIKREINQKYNSSYQEIKSYV